MYREFKNIISLSFLFCFVHFSLFVLFAPNLFAGECPDELVSYWSLDDTAAPYQDNISSNSGVCTTQCPAPASGVKGGAQFFNGTDTGINISPLSSYNWNTGDSFSIEFWLQRSSADFFGPEIIIGRDDGQNSSLRWWVGLNSAGYIQFSLIDQTGTGPSETASGNTPVVDGNWHHVVMVRDGVSSQTLIYVDGTPSGSPQIFSYSAGFQSATAAINIGWLQNSAYSDQNYGGSLDELAIYSRALSEFEIRQHNIDGSKGLNLGYCYNGTPIKIMPLGDSITRGTSTTINNQDLIVGYRQKLFRTLQGMGYSIDFVGGENSGATALPPFDSNHEGHPIWTAAEVANNVYSWLVANPPDIVLLHVGTNNVSVNTGDVEFLLDEIDRYSEDIVVLLARIVNRQTLDTTTTIFNNNIETMAMGRVANGDKIIMVDQEGALLYPNDINDDNLHPTPVGYGKMADTWFAALEGVLPTANPLPVLKFSEDVVALKGEQGVFPQSQSVSLDTLDGIPTTFTITSDSIWLDISTAEETAPTSVTFSVNDNTSPAGLYTAYVTASSPGYVDAVIKVTLLLTTPNSNFQLFASSLPDGSDSQPLQDANLAGDVYVFTSPDTDVSRVVFYLDHEFQRTENVAPFDFAGNDPFDMKKIANGEHEISAIITKSNGQKEVISSSFTVNNLLSSLTLDSTSLTFNSVVGTLPPNQTINIGTSNSIAADFTVSTSVDWLSVTPASGLSPATLTVSVTDTTLVPGTYSAAITVKAAGYNDTNLSVEYTIANSGGSGYNLLLSTLPNRSGAVTLDNTTVSGNIFVFTGPDDNVKRVVFSLDGTQVKTEGFAPFDFAGSAVNGAIPYDTTLLVDGPHEISALITLNNGNSEVVSNTFTVNNNISALTVDNGSISFKALEGNLPFEQTLNLGTSDGLGADFTITTNASWLTVSPATGATPATVTVSVNDATLVPGIYNGSITAIANGYANTTVAVSYTVSTIGGSAYSLLLSTFPDRSSAVTLDNTTVSGDIFVFTGPDDNVKRVVFSLDGTQVKTEGFAPFDFAGSAVNGAIPYDTTLLADGQHEISALITLNNGNSEVVSNTFTVNNNILALTVDNASISFEALEGNLPFEQTLNFGTSDGLGADFTITTNASWLTVSPATGATPATVTVSVNDATLVPGVYNGSITAIANGYANTTVAVSYTVSTIGGSAYSLLLSTFPDRSSAVALDNTTVSGDIFVFTGPDDNVKRVVFSLDGAEVKTEGFAPFDFAGTAVNGAISYDTTQIANGQHEISALIELNSGGSELISNTFAIVN